MGLTIASHAGLGIRFRLDESLHGGLHVRVGEALRQSAPKLPTQFVRRLPNLRDDFRSSVKDAENVLEIKTLQSSLSLSFEEEDRVSEVNEALALFLIGVEYALHEDPRAWRGEVLRPDDRIGRRELDSLLAARHRVGNGTVVVGGMKDKPHGEEPCAKHGSQQDAGKELPPALPEREREGTMAEQRIHGVQNRDPVYAAPLRPVKWSAGRGQGWRI